MAITCNMVLRCAFSEGTRRITDADGATVSVKLLVDGSPSGSNLDLDGAGTTSGTMTQYHPGQFIYVTASTTFTRGSQYRATYTITVGGTTAETVTQDFYAESDLQSVASQTDSPTEIHYYTFQNCKNIVRRALGLYVDETTDSNSQEPGSASAGDIVNDAMEMLWNAHPWTFRFSDPKYLDAAANMFRYHLPKDFGSLVKLVRANNLTHECIRLPIDAIYSLREQSVGTTANVTYYDVVFDPNYSLSAVTDIHSIGGRYLLEIWPTPSAFTQNAWLVVYERECPKLTVDANIAPFPMGFHRLVKRALRYTAFEAEGDPQQDVEYQKYLTELASAIRADGRHGDWNLGSMVERRYGSTYDRLDPLRSHNPSANPTA